ncbi:MULTISPECIES: hypothetical protein [unclassified Lentimicrobium]|uniref:hypothetical protein n=1 Tax=unclassified Lentimicrobium TaxID=2677434 RepID=UPI001555526A|nr:MULTISPECIES: hypothetical protein [unclassified Lentimicrobium]NPD45003.1 hypothetical protein [Lentimicrobium sp. S6]NPD83509.1 hypothetical protein [Lentimicrobium sp. L6]
MKILNKIAPYFFIFLLVSLSIILLIWIDKDTDYFHQIFGWRLAQGYLFYGLPMMIAISYLYKRIRKHLNVTASILTSVIGGVPITMVSLVFFYLIIGAIF